MSVPAGWDIILYNEKIYGPSLIKDVSKEFVGPWGGKYSNVQLPLPNWSARANAHQYQSGQKIDCVTINDLSIWTNALAVCRELGSGGCEDPFKCCTFKALADAASGQFRQY